MKHIARWIVLPVVTCAIGSLVTYRFAYHRGYENGYKNGTVDEIGRGRFDESVAFFAALQQIRAGDIPLATSMMEESCFDSAHIFYKKTTFAGEVSKWGHAQGLDTTPDTSTVKAFAQELSKYRAVYRTNSAEWNDMEQKLAVELVNVR